MAPNPYDNCPCGSGKKFKWCCNAYWDKIEQGLAMYEQGQLENALRVMEMLVKEHPQQPQCYGYYAHILFREGQIDKAEEVLAKAFEIQPNFPMGLLLRGLFRQSEGEVIGALMLFRKAADAYPPEATDQLSQTYEMIARNELILNRPVASRAALELAVKNSPGDEEMVAQFNALFGGESRLPLCARKKYAFRPTMQPIAVPESGRFTDARKAFEELTAKIPADPAAWFNLGLVQAWLGEQGNAIETLKKSLELEYDDTHAEETAALAEVLKCAQGMEADSDYTEHRVYMQIRNPESVMQLLRAWDSEQRIVSPQADEAGRHFSCMVVEPLPNILDTGTTMARVVANVTISDGVIRLWHVNLESVTKVGDEVRDRLNMAVEAPVTGTGAAQFGDIIQEALCYPVQISQIEDAEKKLRDYASNYFENVWANKPLKLFGGATPLDAVGSTLLRKRLLGTIRFLEDSLIGAAPRKGAGKNESVPMDVYDFGRLRHKLGAQLQAAGAPPAELVAAAAGMAKKDFTAMSAADLAGTSTESLSVSEIEDAMRAALKLDARELAVKFAKAGVAKPFDSVRPDRYPMFACVVTGAVAEADYPAAIQFVEMGAAYDAEHNSGKRANEFGLRKAQLLAKAKNYAAAEQAFNELIERTPDEPKFYIAAIEAMLSGQQKAAALAFAEKGKSKANILGNRDLAGAIQELSEAANRLK
jgi:tetratricopeptide (TPR) repeat protein